MPFPFLPTNYTDFKDFTLKAKLWPKDLTTMAIGDVVGRTPHYTRHLSWIVHRTNLCNLGNRWCNPVCKKYCLTDL